MNSEPNNLQSNVDPNNLQPNTESNNSQPNTEGPESQIQDLSKIVMSQRLPEIEVFKHANFNFQTSTIQLLPGERAISPGRERLRTSFNVNLKGDLLDNNISSIIIYSGYWQFSDSNGKVFTPVLGPGQYADVREFGIPNDKISSFKCVGF